MGAAVSAVRDAVAAVVTQWATDDERWVVDPFGQDRDGFIDDLARAVEAVPVTVTIRDLSMTDDDNVLTFSDAGALRVLAGLANRALIHREPLHLTVDQGALKLKIGELSWSAPIYPHEGRYHA